MPDPFAVPVVPGRSGPTLAQMMPAPVVKPPRNGPPRWFWPLMTVTFVLLIAGGLVTFVLVGRTVPPETLWTISQPSPTPPAHSVLYTAQQNCKGAGELFDGEKTLVLDLKGDDPGSGTLNILDFGCILGQLETPAFVIQEMNHTRALDGRQQQTWGTLQASWTYHPDNGLDVIIRDLG